MNVMLIEQTIKEKLMIRLGLFRIILEFFAAFSYIWMLDIIVVLFFQMYYEFQQQFFFRISYHFI